MILDCNTLFGYWQRDCRDTSLIQLLRLLDHSGVDMALTCSSVGVWGDFARGNAETLRACAEAPDVPCLSPLSPSSLASSASSRGRGAGGEAPSVTLLPVATVRPLHYFDCVEEIRTVRERGFRMIRFFPHEQGWSPGHLCFRRLVEPLIEAGLPVFWGYLDEADPAKPIATLVDYFRGSDLPLIFGSVSYALGEFLSACELHPHCYTDTAQLFLLNELEIIRDHVGIEHILFGSHAPFDMPAAPLEVIRHACLTEAERAGVLAGNALRLLGLSEAVPSRSASGVETPASQVSLPPGGMSSRPGGTLSPQAGVSTPDGDREPHPLIDVHAHYGPWPGLPNPYVTLADLLETCDRYCIETCCLSSTVAIGYDVAAGNAEVRSVIEGHDRLRGYVVIHPGYPELSMAELRKYLALSNFVGAKLHPKHCGFQADSSEARPLMEYLAAQGKPLLAHTWYAEMVQAMANLADALPDLVLILGHMGGDDWEFALEAAADRPNMVLELCSGLAPWGKMERAVAMVGAERLLFGSDLTLLEPGFTLGTVTGSTLSETDQRKILYENAKVLFGF
jgi:uncharacterized protein